MKNRKLNVFRLIIANLLFIAIFALIIFLTPDDPRINVCATIIFIMTTLLFNSYVLEW